jgi:hypothetical protein
MNDLRSKHKIINSLIWPRLGDDYNQLHAGLIGNNGSTIASLKGCKALKQQNYTLAIDENFHLRLRDNLIT